MIDAALKFLEASPVDALSFRSLAKSKREPFTATAPLHHFGSRAGLLGAIAERGLRELTATLREILQQENSNGARALVRIAVGYAAYALKNRNLYRAIHDASLWRVVAELSTSRDPAATQNVWARSADAARNDAFGVFVDAVRLGQSDGTLKTSDTRRATRLVTGLVDGYLFQVLEEQVEEGDPEEVARFIELAIRGLGAGSEVRNRK